jgi:Permuted papain-like amidase enzyme, YaeF/YiiX, C92 family
MAGMVTRPIDPHDASAKLGAYMRITRRILLSGTASALSVGLSDQFALAQSGPRIPDPATFESGDFVWPKKPGAFIPYKYESGQAAEEDRERWTRERAEFIERVRRGEVSGGPQIAREIESLSYNEFRTRYLRNQELNQITPFSGGGVAAVGHVAIIQLDSRNEPWIIEALWTPGVVRQRYLSWITTRVGEIVWHGRLKDANRQDRAKIALEAGNYITKPYDFWNFNLTDVSGFYCSKLALSNAVDGNPNPSRSFWLSPKQILYSPKISRLFDPGEYATD